MKAHESIKIKNQMIRTNIYKLSLFAVNIYLTTKYSLFRLFSGGFYFFFLSFALNFFHRFFLYGLFLMFFVDVTVNGNGKVGAAS